MDDRFPVVTPEGWLPKGEAFARVDGHPVSIWQGIPGERAQIRIYRKGQNRHSARWESSHQPHPDRVDPACARYSRCGGCALMHLNPDGQSKAWFDMLRYELRTVELRDVKVSRVVPSPDGRSDFRHVVKLAVGLTDRGSIRVGAFGRNSHDIVPIPKCLVATPALREVMSAVAYHTVGMEIQPYDPSEDRGILRYFVIRQSRSSGKVLLTIIAGRNDQVLRDLAERVMTDRPGVAGVHLHINREPGNAFFLRSEGGGSDARLLNGGPYIEEELANIRYRIGPTDFFQTNPGMADRIYRDVVEALPAGRPLVDLYSGVGGIALAGVRKSGWAIGVEQGVHAVSQAKMAAQQNGLSVEFLAGDVVDCLPEIVKRVGGKRPHVVVNPAWRGLEPGVIQGILDLDPASITYISCNRRSFAVDLRHFVDHKFQVESVTPYEMFPHTAHCEIVAQLKSPRAIAEDTSRAPRRKRLR